MPAAGDESKRSGCSKHRNEAKESPRVRVQDAGRAVDPLVSRTLYSFVSAGRFFIRPAFCFPEIPGISPQNFAGTVQTHVNSQSAGTQAAQPEDVQERVSGAGELPAAPWCVHARLHDHAEEAELGPAQGRQGSPDQRFRGHQLHRWRRSQSAGALGRADPRWSREGPAGRPLPHRARQPRRRWRDEASPEPLEVRREAPEGLIQLHPHRRCGA